MTVEIVGLPPVRQAGPPPPQALQDNVPCVANVPHTPHLGAPLRRARTHERHTVLLSSLMRVKSDSALTPTEGMMAGKKPKKQNPQQQQSKPKKQTKRKK